MGARINRVASAGYSIHTFDCQSYLGRRQATAVQDAPLEATSLVRSQPRAVFVAAIAVGVCGANPITNPTIPHPPSPIAEHVLDIVTYASVGSCGFWIWRMKGFRWFAASLLLLAEVITWGAFIVAGMSVSGDWL